MGFSNNETDDRSMRYEALKNAILSEGRVRDISYTPVEVQNVRGFAVTVYFNDGEPYREFTENGDHPYTALSVLARMYKDWIEKAK